ncbi:DNA-binding protein HEXBP-like [Physella acuta]|uniref:DNA-binding protein HEXBP-like n=1 Tax=Physella acuta TaxID=109671 RepID=UPI0027DAEFB4|nr:DNA-binding protein HEXBP-like [Physella acuta]
MQDHNIFTAQAQNVNRDRWSFGEGNHHMESNINRRNPIPGQRYCSRCGQSGHTTTSCRYRGANMDRTIQCFECQGFGHFKRDCPSGKGGMSSRGINHLNSGR